jgi:biotin carboxyl carrier protein
MTSKLLHYVVEFEDGSIYSVGLDPDDPSIISVEGVRSRVGVEADDRGLVVTTEEGHRVPLSLHYEHGELVAVTPDGTRQRVRVELQESREFRKTVLSQPPPPPIEHSGHLIAPIAGSVLSLCVKAGARIEVGEPLLILEAMKMQNTIVAPTSGVVTYKVTAGQTVRSGDPLATIVAPGSN